MHLLPCSHSTCGAGADEQGAQNERATDDTIAARLYDETARILSAKINAFDSGRQWA
jgi:hypothetical protein